CARDHAGGARGALGTDRRSVGRGASDRGGRAGLGSRTCQRRPVVWRGCAIAAGGRELPRTAARAARAAGSRPRPRRRRHRAQRWTLEAGELYDRLADEELAAQAATSTWLAWAEVLAERFDDAGRHLQRATELSRASQQRIVSMGLLVGRGQVLAFKGQIAEL